jgi:hypothetical protein
MGERRYCGMKGSKWIFACLVLMFCLTAVSARAEEVNAWTITKAAATTSVIPPAGIVRFDAVLYNFQTGVPLNVSFERIDASRVKLRVRPLTPSPYCIISIQWGGFPACYLDLYGDGTSSFTLNTETGYAEK